MTRTDAGYQLTRRRGTTGVVTRVTGSTSDPLTGTKTPTEVTTTVRWMFVEPTAYTRIFRADATQQRIGSLSFTMWTGDLDFTKLTQEDYITFNGVRYEVVTSTVEDTAFIVTAEEIE